MKRKDGRWFLRQIGSGNAGPRPVPAWPALTPLPDAACRGKPRALRAMTTASASRVGRNIRPEGTRLHERYTNHAGRGLQPHERSRPEPRGSLRRHRRFHRPLKTASQRTNMRNPGWSPTTVMCPLQGEVSSNRNTLPGRSCLVSPSVVVMEKLPCKTMPN